MFSFFKRKSELTAVEGAGASAVAPDPGKYITESGNSPATPASNVLVPGKALVPAGEAPFAKAGLWICEKCGKKLGGDENIAVGFQKRMKKETSLEMGKQVRVMISSCLNVCPEGKIAMAIVPVNGSGPAEFFVADPAALDTVRGELLVKLREKTKS